MLMAPVSLVSYSPCDNDGDSDGLGQLKMLQGSLGKFRLPL